MRCELLSAAIIGSVIVESKQNQDEVVIVNLNLIGKTRVWHTDTTRSFLRVHTFLIASGISLQCKRVQRNHYLLQDLLEIQTQITIGDCSVLQVFVDSSVEKC